MDPISTLMGSGTRGTSVDRLAEKIQQMLDSSGSEVSAAELMNIIGLGVDGKMYLPPPMKKLLDTYKWQVCAGFGGRFTPERVAGFLRNSLWVGIAILLIAPSMQGYR